MTSISNYSPIAALLIVFLLIAIRQIGGVRIRIWQAMLAGAAISLLTGSIGAADALLSINADVMIFLFGMFVVGESLVESGYLYTLSYRLFKGARTTGSLVFHILFVMGLLSFILMNDTVAVIGTPLVLYFAERHNMAPKLLLLSLCFSITLGSVPSPIGNPQNLLVAVGGGLKNPFVPFLKYLFIPTVLNLLATYLILRLLYRREFHEAALTSSPVPVADHRLAALSKASLVIIAAMVVARTLPAFFSLDLSFNLSYIAVAAAMPVILFSPKRVKIVKNIDWHTLVFFASMFILMDSVWRSGVFKPAAAEFGRGLASIDVIFSLSVLLSQILSNVPLVAMYLPLLTGAGAEIKALLALAAGSTVAGNLLILGAASNVIIIQNAEKRGEVYLSFMEFAKAGVPVTIVNAAVYWAFFKLAW